jgi:hypothetical protein
VADKQHDAQKSWPTVGWYGLTGTDVASSPVHVLYDARKPLSRTGSLLAPIGLQRRASLPASINSPSSGTTDINNGYDTVTKNEVHITRVHCGFVSVNENRKRGIKVRCNALNRVQLQRSLAVQGNTEDKNGDWFKISLEDHKSNDVLNKTHHWILV